MITWEDGVPDRWWMIVDGSLGRRSVRCYPSRVSPSPVDVDQMTAELGAERRSWVILEPLFVAARADRVGMSPSRRVRSLLNADRTDLLAILAYSVAVGIHCRQGVGH